MKLVRIILTIVCGWYILFGVFLMFGERKMIYFPNTQSFETCPGFADAEPITYKGARFYYKKVSDEKIVVFYHGNAGSACDRAGLKKTFEQSGYSYLFVEYPGYANDTDAPSKRLILQQVAHVREFLQERGYTNVVVAGESLGSGVAAYHAYLGDVRKVLLFTPYDELADISGILGNLYPLRYMMRENYTAGKWLHEIDEPIRVIYASDDEIIPYASTKKLFDSLTSSRKEMVRIDGGTHNTMYGYPETFELTGNFLTH